VNDDVGSPGRAQREVIVLYVARGQLDLLAGDYRAEFGGRDFVEVSRGGQVLSRPYREVVDDPDGVAAFLLQGPYQGRPDKATAARDQPVQEDRSSERLPSKLLVPACMSILAEGYLPRIP